MVKIISTLACTGALLAAASSANAGAVGTTFTLSATVANNCTVSATNINFGAYTPGGGNIKSSVVSPNGISVACTKGDAFNVVLDKGQGATATTAIRQMTNGANTDVLDYTIYTDAAYSSVWGTTPATGVSGTGAGLAAGKAVLEPVYALLFDDTTSQNASAGSYQDKITVTVNF